MSQASLDKAVINRYKEFCLEYGTIQNTTDHIELRYSKFIELMFNDYGIELTQTLFRFEIASIQDKEKATLFKLQYI